MSKYFVKQTGILIFVCIFGILFTGCHRDLSDPFVPKEKKFKTQFQFDAKRNRTVEKHVSFSREKGKFKHTFSGSRGGGRKGGGSKDSFSSRAKKLSGRTRFSKSKGRVVDKGFLPSKRGKDSFASKAGNSKKKNRLGGKDSFSSSTKRHESGNRFSSKKKSVVSFKKGNKGRISGKETFGGVRTGKEGMFHFDKKSKRIVSKKNFLSFGSKKHNRDMGSYAGKKRNSGGMYAFNKKKHRVTKTKAVFGGYKRFRSGDTFGGKRTSRGGEFSFNTKKKRVGKRTMLFKPRDTDPGSFGSRSGGKRNSINKQNTFSKKYKRIHHRNGIFWDIFGGRNKVSRKKKELQLDLFDPKSRHQMHLEK